MLFIILLLQKSYGMSENIAEIKLSLPQTHTSDVSLTTASSCAVGRQSNKNSHFEV